MFRPGVSKSVIVLVVFVIIAGGAAAAYLVSAQNGVSTGNSTTHSSDSTQSQGSASCAAGGGGTVTVNSSYFSGFAPQSITISAGQSVTWKNVDVTGTYYHIVTSDDSVWTSQRIDPGQSVTCTFSAPGTYSYHCAVHSFMTGSVKVTA